MNKFLIFLMLILSTGSFAFAEEVIPEIDIVCNQESESCDVIPSDTAPLFNELDFPNYDLKPGDEFFRRIRVTNNRDEVCYFQLTDARPTEDTLISEGHNFSDRLMTEITDGEHTTNLISFGSLFDMLPETPLNVTALDPDEIEEIDWWVKFDKDAGNEYQRARLVFDFDWTFSCGEEPSPTRLFIEKTNDKIGIVQAPGAQVKYTITVRADEEYPVYNVIVLDLPPGGFNYRHGTWTATSNFRGDIKAGGITTEPTYASPGTWQLGDMAAGEIVELTYITDIENNTQSGIYPDIAWTEGTASNDPSSARVIGNDGTGFFVGTNAIIAVENNPDAKVEPKEKVIEVEEEGEVLGASILPATGANNIYMYIVWSTFGLGVLFLTLGLLVEIYKKKKNVVVTNIIVFAVMGILFSGHVLAADPNLLIRLQEPENPNTEDVLKLNFVVMETEDRPIVVKCFKKAPGDLVFSQFGANLNVISGGNDDYCIVDGSVFNQKGNFDFYVTADAGAGEVVSQTVSFYHDDDRPGKPRELDKDKNGSCKYDISFKTADDGGDTVRVEVFRSDKKEFEANPSTRIRDIAVGSNQSVEFADDKPNCGKTYYYAALAYDGAENISDVAVETLETKETVIVTVSNELTENEESVFGEILAVEVEGAQVGEEVAGGEEGEVTIEDLGETQEESAQGEQPEVLGEKTTNGLQVFLQNNRNYLLSFAILLIILVSVYSYKKKNK